MPQKALQIAIFGSGFAADLHARALARIPDAEVVAISSPTLLHARGFAEKHSIPNWFTDHRALLDAVPCSAIVLACPNSLHLSMGLDVLAAGKDLVCEKPLAGTLADGRALAEGARAHARRIFYGEQLVFAPRYRRLQEIVRSGSIGEPILIKHRGAHSGPHSGWFYDRQAAQGGVILDMASHGVELVRWLYGKPAIRSVFAFARTIRHQKITDLEDDAVLILDFGEDRKAVVESSWAQLGGLHDHAEVYGTGGHLVADLAPGGGIVAYSENGIGYTAEKAADKPGWAHVATDEIWDHGYVGQAVDIAGRLASGQAPSESGDDGLAVLEILDAAYRSAASGQAIDLRRKVMP